MPDQTTGNVRFAPNIAGIGSIDFRGAVARTTGTQVMPVEKVPPKPVDPRRKWYAAGLGAVAFAVLASLAPGSFLGHFTVFALAVVVGYYVISNVSHALHTPLMAETNAISGIILVGAIPSPG